MTANMRIVSTNTADAATLTSSDFVATLPVTNLQLEGRGRVARTTNATGTKSVKGDFAAASVVGCMVLYGHNLTGTATVRLRLWDAAAQTGTLVYDSGTIGALPLLGWGEFGWGLLPWGASVFTGWVTAFTDLWFDAVGALSFQIDIVDTGNPAGYIQVKRLLIGPYFESKVNISYGVRVQWEDNSEQVRTQGGSLRTDNRVTYRTLTGTFQYLDAGERAVLMELLRQIALRKETFVSMYPDFGGAQERDHAMLGKFTRMPDLTNTTPSSYASQLIFEEV